jgi:hypothetical protein
MTLTLVNTLHDTTVNVRVRILKMTLSKGQMKRIERTLCGIRYCRCPIPHTDTEKMWYILERPNGSGVVRPIIPEDAS